MKLVIGTTGAIAECHTNTNEIHIQFRKPLVNGLFGESYPTEDTRTKAKKLVPLFHVLTHMLSHETIHLILVRMEGEGTSHALNNIVTRNQPEMCGI